jgi:hypothetical protein
MRRNTTIAMACLAFAWSIMLTAGAARADGNSIPLTITVTPIWFLNSGSDATAYPPPGTIPINAPTIPRTTDNVRVNYGLSYQFNKRMSLAYSHDNFDFSLGRILGPGTSLLTGDLDDRIDTISFNYGFGHGLNGSVYYFSHQRSYVAGLCLNQIDCPNAAGVNESNPNSINSNGYGVGFKYALGPVSKYTGPLLTFNGDAQYIPRPDGNCSNPAIALPGCGTDGIAGYKASQTIFPYGVTMNVPIRNDLGVIPFIDYKREIVLWRAENSQEMYNVVEFGFVKIIRPDLTFALVESNWKECFCSSTVPPDNVRFSDMIASLTYAFKP